MEGEIYIESDGVDSLSELGLEEKDLEFIGGDYHSRRSFYICRKIHDRSVKLRGSKSTRW
jgi:hypothetical protein